VQQPPTNSTTRRAGGRQQPRGAGSVVVDVREFRSALPNMLHLHGVVVKPVTLEVHSFAVQGKAGSHRWEIVCAGGRLCADPRDRC